MADNNLPFVNFGVQPMIDSAKEQAINQAVGQVAGYVQKATYSTLIPLTALGVPVAVNFATPLEKGDDGATMAGELSLSAGGILFPSAIRGRWSPSVTITASAAVQAYVDLKLFDENGVEISAGGYPARRVVTLAIGQIDIPVFRTITKPTGRTRVLRVYLSAVLGVNITKVELALNKYAG